MFVISILLCYTNIALVMKILFYASRLTWFKAMNLTAVLKAKALERRSPSVNETDMTITSKGNSLVLDKRKKKRQDSTGLNGSICMTSACSAFFLLHAPICFYIHYFTSMASEQLMEAMVLHVLIRHHKFWQLLLMTIDS